MHSDNYSARHAETTGLTNQTMGDGGRSFSSIGTTSLANALRLRYHQADGRLQVVSQHSSTGGFPRYFASFDDLLQFVNQIGVRYVVVIEVEYGVSPELRIAVDRAEVEKVFAAILFDDGEAKCEGRIKEEIEQFLPIHFTQGIGVPCRHQPRMLYGVLSILKSTRQKPHSCLANPKEPATLTNPGAMGNAGTGTSLVKGNRVNVVMNPATTTGSGAPVTAFISFTVSRLAKSVKMGGCGGCDEINGHGGKVPQVSEFGYHYANDDDYTNDRKEFAMSKQIGTKEKEYQFRDLSPMHQKKFIAVKGYRLDVLLAHRGKLIHTLPKKAGK